MYPFYFDLYVLVLTGYIDHTSVTVLFPSWMLLHSQVSTDQEKVPLSLPPGFASHGYRRANQCT